MHLLQLHTDNTSQLLMFMNQLVVFYELNDTFTTEICTERSLNQAFQEMILFLNTGQYQPLHTTQCGIPSTYFTVFCTVLFRHKCFKTLKINTRKDITTIFLKIPTNECCLCIKTEKHLNCTQSYYDIYSFLISDLFNT